MKKYLTFLIILLLLSSCTDKSSHKDDHEGHDHNDHAGHNHGPGEDHDDHDQGSKNSPVSDQALKNMNVKVKAAKKASYTVFNPVPAIVQEAPLNMQPVFAPFGGRVKSINVTIGEYKKAGEVLISIYRDPIKRPELKMVEEILSPASEEFHTAISSLRKNLKDKEILERELKRLETFAGKGDGISVVPKKDIIDIKYSLEKTTRIVESARKKLELHGLKKKEISELEEGHIDINLYRIWKNSLIANNIWNKQADTILSILSKEIKNNRWTIAAIGELLAEDVISDELLSWLKENPETGKSFLEIGSLLQHGHTLSDIKALYKLGVFNQIIELKAPINEKGWDVEELHVTIGQKVSSGDKLLTLVDQSKMLLISEPQASEIVDMVNASKAEMPIDAIPLTKGGGPELNNLKISQIRGLDSGIEEVRLFTKNSILNTNSINNKPFRIWSLRSGQKYILKVPTSEHKDVFTVPVGGVISHGSDKIVFVYANGDFERRKITILHQDNETVVLGPKSQVKIGDKVVISGAFALQLALVAGTPEAMDPHAGHTH